MPARRYSNNIITSYNNIIDSNKYSDNGTAVTRVKVLYFPLLPVKDDI